MARAAMVERRKGFSVPAVADPVGVVLAPGALAAPALFEIPLVTGPLEPVAVEPATVPDAAPVIVEEDEPEEKV